MPNKLTRQAGVYLLGGILSAVVDIGITAALLSWTIAYQYAVSIGFAVGLGFNYLYHARVTFSAPMSIATAARYLFVVALNYCLTMAIVWLFHNVWGQAVLLGKVMSLPIIAANGFLLGRVWIFTAQPSRKDDRVNSLD